MAKYKVLFNDEYVDEIFDTEEEAEEHDYGILMFNSSVDFQ